MPTAVIDLELGAPLGELEVGARYEEAYVLLRDEGCPVGQLRVPVTAGTIDGLELAQAIRDADLGPLLDRIVRRRLDLETPAPGRPATVATITRERPDDLRRCLESLLALPDDGQELLVVDNRPTSAATRELVEGYGGLVRYVCEPRPGSSAARNRALREARHEIVAFTDDDAVVDSGWLRALVRNFDDPQVLAATGLVVPLELETRAQEMFERYTPHGRGFRRRVFDWRTHYALNVSQIGVSANLALRRDLLELVGGFDEALGVGTPSRCGEDYELFARMLTAGYKIVYDPAALNRHRHRRSWQELRDAVRGYGVGVYACWTRQLLVDREPSVPSLAWGWFRHRQAPNLLRAVTRRPVHVPLDLLLAELTGCLSGPLAYLRSRRRLRRAAGAR